MKVRFFSLKHKQADLLDPDVLFKTAFDLINETSRSVMQYVANRMIYIDFNDIIFYNLYVGKG